MTVLGYNSASAHTTGDKLCVMGVEALGTGTGASNGVYIGYQAGVYNQGAGTVAVGYQAAKQSSGEYGLIAEEVLEVMPELVVAQYVESDESIDAGDSTKGKKVLTKTADAISVQYHKLIPLLLAEVQRLKFELDELKSKAAMV